MFVPFDDDWPPPPRWEPSRPARRRLSAREQKVMLWLVGLNLLMLLVAPIAGSTVLQSLWVLVD